MAVQKTTRYTKLLIELDDGAGSYVAPCALNARTYSRTANTSEAVPQDCASPDTVMDVIRSVTSKTRTISGSGILDSASEQTWREWYESGAVKSVKVTLDVPAADGGGDDTFNAVLTTFEITGERDAEAGLLTFNIEMQSSGAATWTDAT